MPYSNGQTRREKSIHLTSSSDSKVYTDSESPDALRQREQIIQADLRDIHQKLANLSGIAAVEQPPAKSRQRRRSRRHYASVPTPRAFDSMFHADSHNPGLAWTAVDFATAFVCGFGVTLLKRSDWFHVAGKGWLGVPSAFMWGGLFAFLTALSTAALSRVTNLHDLRPHRTWLHDHSLILLATALSALGVNGAIHLWSTSGLSKELLALDICLTVVAMSLSRNLWRRRTATHLKRGIVTRNFVIAGADPTGRDVRDYLTSLTYLGYRFKGFVLLDETTADPNIPSEQLLGAVGDLIPLSRALFVDEIIFSRRPETSMLINTLNGARSAGIDVRLIPSVSETLQNRTRFALFE